MATCTSHDPDHSATESEDGAEPEFLEPVSVLQDFECPLCLQVTREPSLTSTSVSTAYRESWRRTTLALSVRSKASKFFWTRSRSGECWS